MKQVHKKIQIFPIMLILFVVSLTTGCGRPELSSKWRGHDVHIDGRNTEWEDDAIAFYDDESHVVLRLINDENNLYIYLSSKDRKIQSYLLRLGCTVWFDSEGGKKKSVGIHFPIGMQGGGMEVIRQKNEKPDKNILKKTLEESRDYLEIIGPNQDERSIMYITDTQKIGIEAQIDIQQGLLVYELKMPLNKISNDSNYNNIALLKTIGIGLETGKIARTAEKSDRGQGRGSLGGRGGRGGKGGRARGSADQSATGIKIWAKINLATQPSAKR